MERPSCHVETLTMERFLPQLVPALMSSCGRSIVYALKRVCFYRPGAYAPNGRYVIKTLARFRCEREVNRIPFLEVKGFLRINPLSQS